MLLAKVIHEEHTQSKARNRVMCKSSLLTYMYFKPYHAFAHTTRLDELGRESSSHFEIFSWNARNIYHIAQHTCRHERVVGNFILGHRKITSCERETSLNQP